MDSKQVDKFADQELVFDCLGKELLDNAFAGYNACIFAYGQTGSGKSYTMMGSHDQAGLIPRLCNVLFERIEAETATGLSFKVEVSYMEIYNEKVRDLLDPSGGRHQLRVREHKLLGPYVDGLQQLAASSAEEVQDLMSQGSKSRTVAATKMNAESSRSHAVFTLIVTHSISDGKSGVSGERVSKLSLVDLAGSERSSKTGASGARLKEGSNINKSLTTLGLVISALADQAAGKAKNKFVPYRDSTLTWILKDNLGGNSRTTMVATLSPSADNYDETLSTLRYADRAKRIVNKAVVNEDPNARIIRELREEVERLQSQLKQSESMRAPDLQDKLDESEKLIQEISQTWEEKLRKTEQAHKKRQETLEKMGISLESSGIKLQKAKCFLVNLNADPSLNELLVYYLKESTLVGQSDESDIQLSGLGIAQSHAEIKIEEGESKNLVTITPIDGARTCVNGQPILSTCRLRHGDRILWGNNHFFRVSIPRSGKSIEDRTHNEANQTTDDKRKSLDISLNESPVSYEFAQQEVLLNQVEGPVQETMMNLEREFRILEGEPTNGTKEVSGKADSKLDDEERKKYETEIDSLRRQLLELTPRQSQDSLNRTPEKKISKQNEEEKTDAEVDVNSVQPSVAGYQKYKSLKEERMKTFRSSISQLRDEVVRAQALVREANAIATELKKDVCFSVTLRIPAHNLTSNRKKGSLLCEPAIQVVRHGKDSQVWSVEKLSNRIIEMREYYEMYKPMGNEETNPMEQSFTDDVKSDPFNETEHGQVLIGVANVFLTCLIQDAPLYYPVPIISQQGQIVGKLLVGVQRLGGSIPEHMLYNEFVDESSVTESASDGNASYSSRSMSSDLRSESSLSSGMGSSVSPDPPPDSICVGNIDKSKDVSSSSLSTSSGPTRSPPHVKHKSQRQAVSHLRSRVTIIEAQGLPANLSHFVECKYSFLDCPDVIVVHSELNADDSSPQRRSSLHIHFNSSTEFTCNITEELVDRLTSNASLAIEVWGHKNRFLKSTTQTSSQQFSNSASSIPSPPTSKNSRQSRKSKKGRGFSIVREKSRSLNERWSEVTKRLQLEVVILELDENGEYEPVEILNKSDVPSIGLFQLKQGQSRRIEVNISPLPHSGTLPLICESIAAVYAGSITVSSVNKDRGLDSYQDEDLKVLRIKWNKVLDRRKAYLDKQMKNVSDDDNKSDFEKERDDKLFAQWVMLTEERNASEAPTVDNEVPGAPASWNPPETFEMHVPIIFLDINSNRVDCDELVRPPAGLDSHLPAELPGSFVQLPFVRPPHADVISTVSRDPNMSLIG